MELGKLGSLRGRVYAKAKKYVHLVWEVGGQGR